jgi:hypothetical protein
MPVNETSVALLSGFSAGLQTIGLHGLNFDRFLDGVIAAFVAEPNEHSTSRSAACRATSSEHTRTGPVPAAFPARGAASDPRV